MGVTLHISKRRKIDTWVHSVRNIGNQEKTFKVDVAIIDGADGIEFNAFSQDWGHPKEIQHRDLNELKRLAEERLASMDIGDDVEWSDYLEISSSGDSRSWSIDGDDSVQSLQIKVRRTRCAILSDGRMFHLSSSGNPVEATPKSGQSKGLFEDLCDEHKSISWIPATQENIAAMKDVMGRLRELRIRLVDVLSQDRISQSLLGLDVGPLLLGDKERGGST